MSCATRLSHSKFKQNRHVFRVGAPLKSAQGPITHLESLYKHAGMMIAVALKTNRGLPILAFNQTDTLRSWTRMLLEYSLYI